MTYFLPTFAIRNSETNSFNQKKNILAKTLTSFLYIVSYDSHRRNTE